VRGVKRGVLVFLLALHRLAWGAGPVIGKVEVVGGTTVSPETVEYYLGVAEGDPYDPQTIAKNFHRFWDSGLLEDLKVEVEELGEGKVKLIVTVKERAKVTEFEFKGNKKLATSTLKEKLDTAGISLRRNVPLRTSELSRIRRTLLEEYAKEGYLSATVEPVVEPVGPNAVKVTFVVDEGAKVRIGEIRFEGNQVFSDARLRRAMKKIKERSFLRPWGKKIIWNKENWGEDSENLKKLYLNHGYKDVVIGEPRVELVAKNPEAPTQAKKKYTTVVTIPVEEGRQYRMVSLRIEGATVLPEEKLRKLYELKLPSVYNYSQVEAGNEAVRTLYQSKGYIYAYTNQVLLTREGTEDELDVVVRVYEGDRWRLGRLEFSGNTKTQDKVLRREFRLFEGDFMNMTAFKRSVFKVNQLGYFKLTEDPVAFDFDAERKLVNVTIKGQEVGRTDIQFGAGYSELDRFFLQFAFNTRNFLGRGETLGVSVQSGTRADTYSLSFSEPYFLDKRQFVGGSIYKTNYDLLTQQRHAKGLSAIWGVNIGDFSTFSLSYGYEDVFAKFAVVRTVPAGGEPRGPHRRPLPPPYKNIPAPAIYYEQSSGVTSAIHPGVRLRFPGRPLRPQPGVEQLRPGAHRRRHPRGRFQLRAPRGRGLGLLPGKPARHPGGEPGGRVHPPLRRLPHPPLRPVLPGGGAVAAGVFLLLGGAAESQRGVFPHPQRLPHGGGPLPATEPGVPDQARGAAEADFLFGHRQHLARAAGVAAGPFALFRWRRAAHHLAHLPGPAALYLRREPQAVPRRKAHGLPVLHRLHVLSLVREAPPTVQLSHRQPAAGQLVKSPRR